MWKSGTWKHNCLIELDEAFSRCHSYIQNCEWNNQHNHTSCVTAPKRLKTVPVPQPPPYLKNEKEWPSRLQYLIKVSARRRAKFETFAILSQCSKKRYVSPLQIIYKTTCSSNRSSPTEVLGRDCVFTSIYFMCSSVVIWLNETAFGKKTIQ